jgi:hypothetical protein
MFLLMLAAALCPFTPNAGLGFYQWAAAEPARALERTVERLHELKAGVIRLYIGPRYDYEHKVLAADRRRWLPADAVRQSRIRSILEDPCVPTVILTTYPGRDYGAGLDDISLNRSWSRTERSAEYQQLRDLAEAIYEIVGDQPKTVIIANSEADARLTDIAGYTGNPALGFQNIIHWQAVRYRAIAQARLLHAGSPVRLLNAFEISRIHLGLETSSAVPDANFIPMLSSIPFDLLSYSAYETTNAPYETGDLSVAPTDIAARVQRDFGILRRATTKPVLIGELGFSRKDFDALPTGGVAERLAAALEALAKEKPEYIVLWQAFDGVAPDGTPDGFGLLEPESRAVQVIERFIRSGKR